MKILFDQGTPNPLRRELVGHDVKTAYEMGWATLENGELLREAEAAFDILITTDQNLRYEQNLSGKRLAILVLGTTGWPVIQQQVGLVIAAVAAIQPGELREVQFNP